MALTKKNLASMVEGLSCEHLNAVPIYKDWTEALGENLDGYTYAETSECSKCGKVVVMVNQFSECRHSDIDNKSKCNGYLHSEGPMMNYFYPCDWRGSIEDAARKISDLPVCAIETSDGTGLALTGGGMDLSWGICEAFIALGFLPPVHFCGSLPNMSGKNLKDEGTCKVLAAARRAFWIISERAKRDCERIDNLEKTIRGETIARSRKSK